MISYKYIVPRIKTGGDKLKIEFESGARIVGTKRVSAKGQVSGLTEYAGKEVMIILVPEEGAAVKPTMEVFYHELRRAAEEHMEMAFKRSQQLSDVFGTPQTAVKQFLDRYTPESVQKMKTEMDKWVKNFAADEFRKQMEEIVKNQMEKAMNQYEELRKRFKTPDEASKEFIEKYAPKNVQKLMQDFDAWVNTMVPQNVREQIKEAADEHIKLAFDQYDRLKEQFGTPNDASKEFMKKYAPDNMNKLLEDMDSWLESFRPKKKTNK
jgi:uncharacterized protein YeaO (DUF488 family)